MERADNGRHLEVSSATKISFPDLLQKLIRIYNPSSNENTTVSIYLFSTKSSYVFTAVILLDSSSSNSRGRFCCSMWNRCDWFISDHFLRSDLQTFRTIFPHIFLSLFFSLIEKEESVLGEVFIFLLRKTWILINVTYTWVLCLMVDNVKWNICSWDMTLSEGTALHRRHVSALVSSLSYLFWELQSTSPFMNNFPFIRIGVWQFVYMNIGKQSQNYLAWHQKLPLFLLSAELWFNAF